MSFFDALSAGGLNDLRVCLRVVRFLLDVCALVCDRRM